MTPKKHTKAVLALRRYYKTVDRFRSSYFWSGFGNAKERENLKNQWNFEFAGTLKGKKLYLLFKINPSRNNLYKTQSILLNDKKVQKVTIIKMLTIAEREFVFGDKGKKEL